MAPRNWQNYGFPIYGCSCIPAGAVITGFDSSYLAESNTRDYIVVAGGSALMLAHLDRISNSLSDQPVTKLETLAYPYRMALHPRGEGIIISPLSKSHTCRWFEWDRHGIKQSALNQLEGVGLQLALTFSRDGSLLAAGGEDGCLRVFKWPRMEIVLCYYLAHSSVKDLDFNQDGKFLVSVGGSCGPCRVWNMASSRLVASLPNKNDEVFGFCRFVHTSDGTQVLYTTTSHHKGGSIVQWSATTWKRIRSKQIVSDSISAMNVSKDGTFVAIGTTNGDIFVINSATMQVTGAMKKAHLGIVTTLEFSSNSRTLISASVDASLRVSIIKNMKKQGIINHMTILQMGILQMLLLGLLIHAAYLINLLL